MRYLKYSNTRSIARLLLFVLTFNICLPLFASVSHPNPDQDSQIDPFSQIIFCTSQGIKVIDLESFLDGSYLSKLDSYPEVENNSSQTHVAGDHCPLCLMSANHFIPYVTLPFTFENSLTVSSVYFNHLLLKPSSIIKRGFSSRAPPIA